MMTTIRNRMEALSFRLFLKGVRMIGLERASAIGGHVFRLIGPNSRHHPKILKNLKIVFPSRDRAWHERMTAAVWRDFGRGLAEYAFLPELCGPAASSRIAFVDHADTEALGKEGRPIVFVAAHQANWNLPAVVGRMIGRPLSVLYRRRKNPHLEAVVEQWRNQMPSGFIDVGARAPKAMLDELKNGRCIGLFIDRRSRDGEEIPFFGLETPTPTIAARLALKTGAAFIPVRTERLPNVHFRITLYPPIVPDPEASDEREAARKMTEAANRLFESWIFERPEQWLSTSKRWPRGTAAKAHEAAKPC